MPHITARPPPPRPLRDLGPDPGNAGRRPSPTPADGPRTAPRSRWPPHPRRPPVVTDHHHVRRIAADERAGDAEQPRGRFLESVLVGQDVGVDQGVEPMGAEDRAQVPADVADHADGDPRPSQTLQHLLRVRIRLPCLRPHVAGIERVVQPRPGKGDGPGQTGVRLAVQGGAQVPPCHRVRQPFRDPERRGAAREGSGLREPVTYRSKSSGGTSTSSSRRTAASQDRTGSMRNSVRRSRTGRL